MEHIDRKKRYYLKHRDRILRTLKQKRKQKRLTKREAVATFFGQMTQWISRLSEPVFIEKLFLTILILSCTGFLISESSHTLNSVEGQGGLVKAVLCEGVLVGISMFAGTSGLIRALRGAILLGICFLILLNTIGTPLTNFSQMKREVGAKRLETSMLRDSLAEKRELLKRYIEKDRLSGARRIEAEISLLSEKLTKAEQDLSVEKSELILILGIIIAVLYRLVMVGANIIFAKRLGAVLREGRVQMRPKLVLMRA